MIAILRNNFIRLMNQKQLIGLLLFFTLLSAISAIFISTRAPKPWNVAVVAPAPLPKANDALNLIPLTSAPGLSSLIMEKYDALFILTEDGQWQMESIKNDQTALALKDAFLHQTGAAPVSDSRSISVNIIGFLMMFLLLTGSMAMCMFSEDKEQQLINRVLITPIKLHFYLAGHCLFHFLFLFLPVITILLAIKIAIPLNFGCTWFQLAGMIGLICTFTTAFSLFLYGCFENKADSAKMTGNAVIILTSILAGSFYAFETGNRFFEYLTYLLPQKIFIHLTTVLTSGQTLTNLLLPLAYIVFLILLLYSLTYRKLKRLYLNRR